MGFWEWLTGHDEKESDVYANIDSVKPLVEKINSVATKDVDAAKSKIDDAVNSLKKVNGVSEYIQNLDFSYLDGYYDTIEKGIKDIGTKIQSSADDIETYNNASWWEKGLSSLAMFSCKATEGLVSIVEDLGDGVASLGGWAVGGIVGLFNEKAGKSIKDGVSSFVNAEWSHDMFNFYYQSDFAKKSAFTEDSGIAGATKIISKTVGYVALTVATAGIGSGAAGASAAASAAGTASKVASVSSKVFGLMSKVGSASTWAGTGLAFVSGVGSGTESGLRQGKNFDDAFGDGVKQGGIEAGIAFVGGKIADKMAKSAKAKDIEKLTGELDDANANLTSKLGARSAASDKLNKANEVFEMENAKAITDYAKAGEKTVSSQAARAAAKTEQQVAQKAFDQADDAVREATKQAKAAADALDTVKNTSLTRGYIYNGKVTGKIYDKGYDIGYKTMGNVAEKGLVKGTAANLVAGAKSLKSTVGSGAKSTFQHVKHPVQTVKTAASSAGGAVKSGAKSAGKAAVNAVKHPIHTTGNLIKGAASGVKTVATTPATYPIAAGAINVTGSELFNTYSSTAGAAKPKRFDETDALSGVSGSAPSIDPGKGKSTKTKDPKKKTGDNGNGSTSTGGTSTGGSSTGGSSTGGSSTGGSSTGGTTTSGGLTPNKKGTAQFNKKDTEADDKKNKANETKSEIVEAVNTNENPNTNTSELEKNLANLNESANTNTNTPAENNSYVGGTINGNSGVTQHTGGGYSGGGYVSDTDTTETDDTGLLTPLDEALLGDNTTSIDEIVKGSKYTKIPTSSKPISSTSSKGSGSSAVIPIAAGLSAAAAAGIGAKAYMDRKKNNDVDDEDDDFETEDWTGEEDSLNINYDDSSDTETYLDEDDEYSYQESTEPEEKYGARNSEELADLQ